MEIKTNGNQSYPLLLLVDSQRRKEICWGSIIYKRNENSQTSIKFFQSFKNLKICPNLCFKCAAMTYTTMYTLCSKRISHLLFYLNLNIKFIILSRNTFVSDYCHKSRKSFWLLNAESDVLVKDDKFIRFDDALTMTWFFLSLSMKRHQTNYLLWKEKERKKIERSCKHTFYSRDNTL